ncbi:MAG: hypothetical protein JO330_15090 [Mycobacteriaceae bacterium]|nr:hypothetical protein [Mycobacteriaceae bacterium]
MSILPIKRRILLGSALCAGLTLAPFGYAIATGQAAPVPAPMDDPAPAPPAPPAPDPSTIINQANTILPIIGQFAQYLPSFLDPNTADPGALQPPMLSPFMPSS